MDSSISSSSFIDDNKTHFFDCIRYNKENELKNLLKFDIENHWLLRDPDDFTGLHLAIFNENVNIFNILIEETKKKLVYDQTSLAHWINLRTNQGFTPLLYASFKGNIEMIKILISLGADLTAKNNEGLGLIHLAAQGNQPNSIIYFNEKFGLNLTDQDEIGSTPLHWSCYTGSEDSFLFLIFMGINLDIQDKEGLTPLHICVVTDRLRIAKKLLYFGANKFIKDFKGRTPLDIAKERNNLKFQKILSKASNIISLYNVELPLMKLEKSSLNMVSFYLLHLFIEFIVFFMLIPKLESNLYGIFYLCMFGIVFINFVYLSCSDPGFTVSKSLKLIDIAEDPNLAVTDYCPKCCVNKEKTRHCLICKKCVENFDHHCFWVNNCIGAKNKKIFNFFLIVLMINFFYNLFICIFSWIKGNSTHYNRFPHKLPGQWLYNETAHLIITIGVTLITVIFMVLIILIVLTNLKNTNKGTRNNDKYTIIV